MFDLSYRRIVVLIIVTSGSLCMKKQESTATAAPPSRLESDIDALLNALPPQHASIRQMMEQMGGPVPSPTVVYTTAPACNSTP